MHRKVSSSNIKNPAGLTRQTTLYATPNLSGQYYETMDLQSVKQTYTLRSEQMKRRGGNGEEVQLESLYCALLIVQKYVDAHSINGREHPDFERVDELQKRLVLCLDFATMGQPLHASVYVPLSLWKHGFSPDHVVTALVLPAGTPLPTGPAVRFPRIFGQSVPDRFELEGLSPARDQDSVLLLVEKACRDFENVEDSASVRMWLRDIHPGVQTAASFREAFYRVVLNRLHRLVETSPIGDTSNKKRTKASRFRCCCTREASRSPSRRTESRSPSVVSNDHSSYSRSTSRSL
jgi:hypothetical protein